MKELKFRAWDGLEQKMYEVAEIKFMASLSNPFKVFCDYNLEIDEPIVMQYTCLKDQNGKEIYEGDIIEHSYGTEDTTYKKNISVVEWNRGCFTLGVFSGYGWWSTEVSNLSRELLDNQKNKLTFKIIGNIYESPELLTN